MTERYNKPLTGSKMSFQGFTCEKERIFGSCLIISQTLQVFLISFISHIYLSPHPGQINFSNDTTVEIPDGTKSCVLIHS